MQSPTPDVLVSAAARIAHVLSPASSRMRVVDMWATLDLTVREGRAYGVTLPVQEWALEEALHNRGW